MTLALCLYAAMMYSCMRSCMTETKAEWSPGIPGHWAFLVSALWPLIFLWSVSMDIAKGVRELLTEKK